MNLTASATDLALRCAHPFQPDIYVARTDNAASTKGTEEHARIAGTIDADPEAEPDDDMSETQARWFAEFWEHERTLAPWEAEVAVALNPRTGSVIEVPRTADGHRDYGLVPRGFIPGTADAVSWDPVTRHLRIVDWKSGQAEALKARELVRGADGRMVARQAGWRRPSEMGQLLTLGAAFARLYGARTVSLEVVPVNEHRLHHVAEPVSRLDLRLHEQRLAAVQDAAERGAAPTPGPWCKALYCPLLGHCAATAPSLAQTVPAVALSRFPIALHSADFQSPEHVVAQLRLIEQAEPRLEAARLAVKMWVKTYGPARGADGYTLAMEPQSRETLDAKAPGALDALRSVLGDAADAAVSTRVVVSLTKGGIEEAVKPGVDAAKEQARARGEKVGGITYKAAVSAALAALRKVDGAVKRNEWETLALVPPAPALEREPAARVGAADDAA